MKQMTLPDMAARNSNFYALSASLNRENEKLRQRVALLEKHIATAAVGFTIDADLAVEMTTTRMQNEVEGLRLRLEVQNKLLLEKEAAILRLQKPSAAPQRRERASSDSFLARRVSELEEQLFQKAKALDELHQSHNDHMLAYRSRLREAHLRMHAEVLRRAEAAMDDLASERTKRAWDTVLAEPVPKKSRPFDLAEFYEEEWAGLEMSSMMENSIPDEYYVKGLK